MSDYIVDFEVQPGQFRRTAVGLDDCSYTFRSDPPEKKDHSEEIKISSIKGVESSSPAHMKFTTWDNNVKSVKAVDGSNEDSLELFVPAVKLLTSVIPMVPLDKLFSTLEINPPARYRIVSDAHSEAVRDANYALDEKQNESTSDAERIFCLSDFHMRCTVDSHRALLSVLQHSVWFKQFDADGMKLTGVYLEQLVGILRRNVTLEGINLSNTGLGPESLQEIAFALTVNSASSIVEIDLSHNALRESGISTISAALANLPRGLRKLILEKTGMTSKLASKHVFKALVSNSKNAGALQCLELGGLTDASRKRRGYKKDIQNILIYLAIPNNLQKLDLSGGDMDLLMVVGSLQSGCLLNLRLLNLSGNTYPTKNREDREDLLKIFCMNACNLEDICLSDTGLTAHAFRNVLIGLCHNQNMEQNSTRVRLDVSNNNLGTEGADILVTLAQDLKNVTFLDVTNNGLDRSLTHIFESLKENQSIQHLSIGNNFSFSKQKPKDEALNALKVLMQCETSALESIDVSNSSLGNDTLKVLSALENCTKIKKIDLRGNNMGDVGAAYLAKILHTNTSLTWLSFDCNKITVKGLGEIAKALKRSKIMREVAVPTDDIARAVRKDSAKGGKPMNTFLIATFNDHQKVKKTGLFSILDNQSTVQQSPQQQYQHAEASAGSFEAPPRTQFSEPHYENAGERYETPSNSFTAESATSTITSEDHHSERMENASANWHEAQDISSVESFDPLYS